MEDIIIRYAPLPPKIYALVAEDEEGCYNIYVNPSQSFERQREAVRHEYRHIKRKHLDGEKTAKVCEEELWPRN